MNDVLQLFHGLDERQAQRFRRSIIPTLAYLRELVVAEDAAKRRGRGNALMLKNSGENTGDGRDYEGKED
jgi:hypothetical protein